MSYKYDFVIVGAGFAGASCARLLTNKGYKCLVIEERPFVSGNCVSTNINGIEVHLIGAHVIHTSDEEVWHFLNANGLIREYYPKAKIFNDKKLYSFPVSISTLREVFDACWPHDLSKALDSDTIKYETITNIEEFCLQNYGHKIYTQLYQNIIEKNFDIPCKELSVDNLEYRNKISFVDDDRLYKDKYQGIPEYGYTKYIEGMLGEDIDIMLNTDFLANKDKYISLGQFVIYTGEIDKLFNYCIGALEWKSAIFDLEDLTGKTKNMFGNPIVFFSDPKINWVRAYEHKWLDPSQSTLVDSTVITYEYINEWKRGQETYYPVLTPKSTALYDRYIKKLQATYPNMMICGRKAEYNFAHIADVVRSAINITDKFPDKN